MISERGYVINILILSLLCAEDVVIQELTLLLNVLYTVCSQMVIDEKKIFFLGHRLLLDIGWCNRNRLSYIRDEHEPRNDYALVYECGEIIDTRITTDEEEFVQWVDKFIEKWNKSDIKKAGFVDLSQLTIGESSD